jgi:BirA family biotin operon repressor/biotin-[acetyl-CoA-carboxylase] ligase
VSDVTSDLARAADAIVSRGMTLGTPLVIAEETESTNDDAKRGAREGAPHGALWIAEAQTSGRGRQGRTWSSPPGENLLFSVLLRLRCAPARVPPVSLACGLAVRDAVARAIGSSDADVVVKWPNDVLVRSTRDGALRKVAGILVESGILGAKVEYVVVGIGINVHTRTFPEELATIATSIVLEREARPGSPLAELNRGDILAGVLEGLDRDVDHVAHKGLGLIHTRLTRHDALFGQRVESPDGDLRGVARGVDLEGRLLVETEDGGLRRVSAGEVRIRLA